jgi:hypothetical protein
MHKKCQQDFYIVPKSFEHYNRTIESRFSSEICQKEKRKLATLGMIFFFEN